MATSTPMSQTSAWVFTVLLLLVTQLEFGHAQRLATGTNSQPQCMNPSSIYYAVQCKADDDRYELEHNRLLDEIDRQHGRWNSQHPGWSILEALHGFNKYGEIAGEEIDRHDRLYGQAPRTHRKLLNSIINYAGTFEKAHALLDNNVLLCRAIVESSSSFYNITRLELENFIKDTSPKDSKQRDDVHKMLRTHISHALKHAVRDWSIDGQGEREATFSYFLSAITDHFISSNLPGQYKVLVPGAGLGRLAHEISLLDTQRISVTTNEKDNFMNHVYRYISTPQSSSAPRTFHPFLDTWSHARTRENIYRSVTITPPDPQTNNVLLIPGDFVTLPFPGVGTYSAVATLFFIDTARDMVAYLKKIHALLRPGGIWINVGPLLYGSAPFMQLTLDEVIRLAEGIGFEIESREERLALYNFNGTELHRNTYVVQCWVARKKTSAGGSKEWWKW